MNFRTFEMLVKTNTQDAQSKMPEKFQVWKTIIEIGIRKLELETELDLSTTDTFESESDNIPLIEDITMALVFYVSQLFTNDINLKQKFIVDYEDAKGTYLWNKFKEMELNK